MLPVKRNKLTLEILGKLREKGVPDTEMAPTGMPFESEGEDISPDGSIVTGEVSPELLQLKKKKKPISTL